jgi:predicted HAD superfamily Cof-like phosphohydrolase
MALVTEFHRSFGLDCPSNPPLRADPEKIRLRMRLIREEFDEVMAELTILSRTGLDPDATVARLRLLLKELCDLRYVVDGTAVSLGLPMEAAFAEVHRSNMSKLGLDGRPIIRDDGKVLKGSNYSAANMSLFVPEIISSTCKEDND